MEEKPKEQTITVDDKTNFLNSIEEKIKRHEETLKKMEALTIRNEELAARALMGGRTNAGPQIVEPKKETPDEYRKRIELEMKEGKLK
jgi:hypothetical protein